MKSDPDRSRRRPSREAASDAGTRSRPRLSIEQALDRQPWKTLRPALSGAGAEVERALGRLRQYAQLVLEWNRSVSNIMSRNDEQRIVERHLLESIAPAPWLRECGAQHWIDLGSGAGLPAIPLAIAGVGGAWTLVESRRTKTLFVRKALQEIALNGFVVVNDRIENVVGDSEHALAFDGFTSRATMRLGPTLALASRLVRPGGSAFLWKGSGWEQEMELDPTWRGDWDIAGHTPIGNGPNVVTRFSRKETD